MLQNVSIIKIILLIILNNYFILLELIDLF